MLGKYFYFVCLRLILLFIYVLKNLCLWLCVCLWLCFSSRILKNLAVLLVLLCSRQKLSVSRFLVCHLALADLCMGLYLLLIACMDQCSRREYYNHATAWQTGSGCGVAGFFTVFSSELSVFTLTDHAGAMAHQHAYLRSHKKLRLRQVAAMMAVGWAFSLLAALLPMLGVSSYSKVRTTTASTTILGNTSTANPVPPYWVTHPPLTQYHHTG